MEEDHHSFSSPPSNAHCQPSMPRFCAAPTPPSRTLPFAVFASLVFCLFAILPGASAAFINFDNCLPDSTVNGNYSGSTLLQFVPLFVDARYIHYDNDTYRLNITYYGNVTGQAVQGTYPPPGSPRWDDESDSFGKFVNASERGNYTTLSGSAQVLSYTPWPVTSSQFCTNTVNASCPVGPAFDANASNPYELPGFTIAHDFDGSYAFTTFDSESRVLSGDRSARALACISASITPDIGSKVADAVTYIPLAILILVGLATILAARFSPWSSPNLFYWSSNFGRDPDLLRLITPGFGDCLQYIQFTVLAGSLSLNYPGYYQPVVSQASWSVLMFNESFVTGGDGAPSLRDGIYFTDGTYGISRMSQLVGMTDDSDIWAGMATWLCIIIASVVILCQLAFFAGWLQHAFSHDRASELRNKNVPFTAGMIVRICFNYFNLPLLSLSLFQLVTAPSSPASVVACAVVLIFLMLGSAAWIFRLIFSTKPRVQLFDDLPTLLAYGPLYNTYSDEAAPFAFIPVLLNFLRGAAIGAVQPSGIAQIIILAICEVIMILTLHAFRPFNAPTSMNAYHTFFSIMRLVTTLLSIAFVPSLGVSEGTKGWLGYVILLLHAIVLVLGFFVNAIQTLLEVALRLSGAGNREARGGLTKVFGMRQLAKRNHRKHVSSSLTSDAAILTQDPEAKSIQLREGRSRSLSASSAVLLQQQMQRMSTGLEGSDWGGTSAGPSTPGATTPFSHLQGGSAPGSSSGGRRGTVGSKSIEQGDPYYRQPRPRRTTLEPVLSDDALVGIAPQPYQDSPEHPEYDAGEGPSNWTSPPHRGSITPAFLRASHHSDNISEAGGQAPKSTDYAVRESDFYYGVRRGPALSSVPQRRLKTGPADPVGPVSSATGWFKTLFGGGKSKEKHKGFEVVRSRPFPLAEIDEDENTTSPPVGQEPYRDSPEAGDGANDSTARELSTINVQKNMSREQTRSVVTPEAPLLDPIDAGGDLKMPSRIGSQASREPSKVEPVVGAAGKPHVPRRSSKRTLSSDISGIWGPRSRSSSAVGGGGRRAPSTGPNTRSSSAHRRQSGAYLHPGGSNRRSSTTRLPFGGADFAPDSAPDSAPGSAPGSSADRSPSPDRGRRESRGKGIPRDSHASSFYPPSEPGTPIFGGEGAGVDDASSGHTPSRERTTTHSRGLSVQTAESRDRPVSTGRVGRHLARDHLRDAAAELRDLGGSSRGNLDAQEAEFVGGPDGGGNDGTGAEGAGNSRSSSQPGWTRWGSVRNVSGL